MQVNGSLNDDDDDDEKSIFLMLFSKLGYGFTKLDTVI